MTGIERLSEVVRELGRFSFCYDLYETLGNIADQIEREQDAMVADSPYDALPPDERDAIAWVREHGGVDAVKAHWEGYVPASWLEKAKSSYQRKRDNLKAHAWDLERKCGERRERIRELSGKAAKQSDEIRVMRDVIAETCARLGVEGTGSTVDDAQVIWREISRRLMPEGMEWLVEAWPRFEDDAPVRFLDDFERYGDENGVSAVTMYSDGSFALNCRAYSKGEHVKRPDFHNSTKVNARLTSHSPAPAPKVLDADGAEIRVGDTVYHVKDGSKMTVFGIEGEWIVVSVGGRARHDIVTHRAPVLAADGKPLREGETVWYRDHIDPLEVRGISTIESGAQYVKAYNDYEGEVSAPAEDFTHERPVADTWERLEKDAGCTATKYNERRGTIFTTKQQVARDLVRRARALAERDA